MQGTIDAISHREKCDCTGADQVRLTVGHVYTCTLGVRLSNSLSDDISLRLRTSDRQLRINPRMFLRWRV